MHVVAFVFVCGQVRCLSLLVATCVRENCYILCLYNMYNLGIQYGVVVSY